MIKYICFVNYGWLKHPYLTIGSLIGGFHATKSEFVDAPLIDELPLAMECMVKSFEDGILIGEIVNNLMDCDIDGFDELLKKYQPYLRKRKSITDMFEYATRALEPYLEYLEG